LSGRGLCDELITRPEESYRLCCVVLCDLETSRMGAPYIYDISHLRVKNGTFDMDVIVHAKNVENREGKEEHIKPNKKKEIQKKNIRKRMEKEWE